MAYSTLDAVIRDRTNSLQKKTVRQKKNRETFRSCMLIDKDASTKSSPLLLPVSEYY